MIKSLIKDPFYLLFHPFDGFNEIKWGKRFSVRISLCILLAWFAVTVFKRQATAFPFNPNRLDDLNILLILASTIGVFILWVVSNWSLCTLMDGEGSVKEIWVASSYALLPYILVTAFVTVISNFLSLELEMLVDFMQYIGVLWSGMILFVGIYTIHQYQFKGTILTIAFTVVGMLLITFLGSLVFTLFQQVYAFLYTIYTEISLRL